MTCLRPKAFLSNRRPLVTLMEASVHLDNGAAPGQSGAQSSFLDNGMQVVVIPDHRAPVATHMVWYRVGAADEAPGESGVAHFLEHLMFKGTENLATGEFSKTVALLGGQENAFTGQDVTAYFQRVASDRLPEVMRLESERMTKLLFDEDEVATERDVVLEERRMRIENNPPAILAEQMNAALYLSHTYSTPIIGWMHEIEQLTREETRAFYQRHYAPNNAILVVAGDVDLSQVMALAREHYGSIPSNKDVFQRPRPREPQSQAARRVELRHERAGQPMLQRYYLAPSYVTAEPGDAEALDLLMKVVASGATSRLYKALVTNDKIASNAGGYYSGAARDYGKIVLYGLPAEGHNLEEIEAAINTVLDEIVENGITEAELERAKKVYLADDIYERDSQTTMARRYGYGLVTGQTIEDIESWPSRIESVTLEQTQQAARKHLDIRNSVTGILVPDASA